ncbi:MAG: PBSX family phage terminase large subunit [Desulfotomaculaceae bacterium]
MPTINLNIPAGAFNTAYIPYINTTGRYEIFYGGAGSGKSRFAAQKNIIKACRRKRKILVTRKVGRTLRDSVFAEVREVLTTWGLVDYCNINKTDMTTELPNGSVFLFRGLDDVEKVKSISGVTDIWGEEASELSQSDFTQLDLRLRGVEDPQIILTFNPVLATHWLKKHFFDQDHGATILKTTHKDNRYLDQGYRDLLESLKEQDFYHYQVYALGEWGTLGELILTNYVIEEYDLNPENYKNVNSGLDFGFMEPSALLQVGERDGELYILEELYRTKLTNQELIDAVEDTRAKEYPVIADSAEPDRIKEFQQRGFKITGAKKGKGYKKYAIDTLRRKRIHVHPSFINFKNEIEAWQYKKTKDGVVLEEPCEYNDHLMDALIYGTQHLREGPRKAKAGKFPGYR